MGAPGGPSAALPAAFEAALAALAPDWAEARLLAAFSGGLDSTALVRLAAPLCRPGQLGAAHLHHGLRGEAADRDQAFCARVGRELNLTFLTAGRDVPALARQRRLGTEEAARRARYGFLARAARLFGAKYVLTAHHQDDQAETLLLNLIHGCGPSGLAGIRPVRRLGPAEDSPVLLRPLLTFRRAELESWLRAGSRPWAEDLSNLDPRHRRNRLRLEILPALTALNPRLGEACGRLAALAAEEEEFWRTRLAALEARAGLEITESSAVFSRAELERLSPAERRRLIHRALGRLHRARPRSGEPLTLASVDTALSLLAHSRHRGLDLPGGLRAAVDPQTLRLSLASRFQSE